MPLADNFNRPAPRWYRLTKKIWGNTESFAIAIWLTTGHSGDAVPLLIFKLASAFVQDNLETILANGTEYAVKGTTEALVNITGVPAKQAVKMNTDPGSPLTAPIPEQDKGTQP